MVRASHVIFGTYGFWLPNDPRGSWSEFVRRWELFRYGPATKTDSRRSVAAVPHDWGIRQSAKDSLKYPAVKFTGQQAVSVAHGFRGFSTKQCVTIWACSILAEHVHLVVARHRYKVEQVVNLLRGAATRRLLEDNRHPLIQYRDPETGDMPSPWARRCWKVFLDSDAEIRRAIRYVENNAPKRGNAVSIGRL